MRHIAIICGDDWTNSSCTHLKVPESVNLKIEHGKYRKWYNEEYRPAFQQHGGLLESPVKWCDFPTWLKNNCGALDDNEIEVFFEE